MLLRVRGPGGTHKIRCEPSTPYAELIALAESACGWSGAPGSLRLSLNKKDPLDLELGAAVGSGGLCGGDLLHILGAQHAGGAAPRAAPAVAQAQQMPPAAAAAAAAERRQAAAAPPRPPSGTTTVRYPAASDTLVEMGFAREQADSALEMSDGSLERAAEILMSGALEQPEPPAAPTAAAAAEAPLNDGTDGAMDVADDSPPPPPPPALGRDEVFQAARAAVLDVLREAGFEQPQGAAQGAGGRHCLSTPRFPDQRPLLQFSLLRDYVNVHAVAWDGAPLHLLAFRGASLGNSMVDVLCSLVTQTKAKILRPMLHELTLGSLLRTASASGATIEPAEALAIALHAVMLSSGFANRQPAAAEGFPEGWNLGGGNFSFAYTLASGAQPGAAPPSVLLKAVAMGDRLMAHAMVEAGQDGTTSAPPVFDATFSIREHTAAVVPGPSAAAAEGAYSLAPLTSAVGFAEQCQQELVGNLLAQISPPPTLSSLPPEVRVLVCAQLPLQALGRAAALSRDWRHAACAPAVWRSRLTHDFPAALTTAAAGAPEDRVDWAGVYKAALVEDRREKQRRAEERAARREMERQREMARRMPVPMPAVPAGPAFPAAGGGFGMPGRNPLMAGGEPQPSLELVAVQPSSGCRALSI